MELVEGEDLSQRIARGAIPLDEALPIAKQIAEALEAAHEQGIIHRDLKPANIKVRADGTVKVLDFGLAKAMDPPAGSSPNVSQSPTITTPAMTQAGMILGTAAYMAPEQARGTAVDKRADVWAFGVVLYEMLTGTRLFAGATVSDTLAAVLKTEPDWTTLPAGDAAVDSSTAAPVPREGSKAPPRFGRGRAPRDRRRIDRAHGGGWCVRLRRASDERFVARTRALDGRARRHSRADRGTGGARRAPSARDAATRSARDASGDHDARHRRAAGLRPLARRPVPRLRGLRRRAATALAAPARRDRGAAAGGHGGRDGALLVPRQPRDRVLCRRQAPPGRPHRRCATGAFFCEWDQHQWQLERGRHDPVSATAGRSTVARRGGRGRTGGRDASPIPHA